MPNPITYEEITSYTCIPIPPDRLDQVEAQSTHTTLMTDTLLEE